MKTKKAWYGTVILSVVSVAIILFLCLYYFEKTNIPKAFGQIPTEHQLKWNELEYYMFIHFGPNTFTNVEWGNGEEDPKVFNPTDVDCRQWASLAKGAGMKGIIITAKHHDGFCLWPSDYSTHTVRESLWKDGKGDLLKELSEACKEYDLKFGVYLSPWDQNHPSYGTEVYNEIFAKTLTEVLTNYGDVYEQWFDGANGGNNKQPYDWNLFHDVVYKHQPQAVIFSDIGPGCRWIGNERGVAGETNWSRIDTTGYGPGLDAPVAEILNEGLPNGEAWVPGEVDVSIRPGWFYSPTTNDKVKTVNELMDIYYTSVGRNANLLLNVPPSRTGRIHTNDSTRLMEFHQALQDEFKTNLTKGTSVSTSVSRGYMGVYSASKLIDGDKNTYWATDDDVKEASIIIDLKSEQLVNRVLLQEYIALGQRISSFNIEAWDATSNSWLELAQGTTIGYKRILRFAEVSTSQIKINIHDALSGGLAISNVEIYKAPGRLAMPQIKRTVKGELSITCESKDAVIYYTLDGSDPTTASPRYSAAIDLAKGATVKAITAVDHGSATSGVVTTIFDVAPADWKQTTPKSTTAISAAIDADDTTSLLVDKTVAFVVDLGKSYNLKGFTYTPDTSDKEANIQRYTLYASENGVNWVKVKTNAPFDNIKNNPIQQRIYFDSPISGQYLKLEAMQLTENSARKYAIAEFGIITQ